MFIESSFFEKERKYLVVKAFSSGDSFEVEEKLVFDTSWFNRYDCCYVFEFKSNDGSKKIFWVTSKDQLLEYEKNFKLLTE